MSEEYYKDIDLERVFEVRSKINFSLDRVEEYFKKREGIKSNDTLNKKEVVNQLYNLEEEFNESLKII